MSHRFILTDTEFPVVYRGVFAILEWEEPSELCQLQSGVKVRFECLKNRQTAPPAALCP